MKNIRNKISFLPQRSSTLYEVCNYVGGYAWNRTIMNHIPITRQISLPVCLNIFRKLKK
jgi:hypothetical protein